MGVVSLSSKVVKTEIKKYLKDWDVRESVGVTLTLKQRVKNHSLDVISCSRNLKHFLNRLNTKINKTSQKVILLRMERRRLRQRN